MGHGGEFWQNVVHWRGEWKTTSVFLPWEPHEQYEKAKNRTLKEELPRSVGAQYTTGDQWRITPERLKRQSQSKNNTQWWMWLVMEVKSNAVKSSIAQEPGILGPWIKTNSISSVTQSCPTLCHPMNRSTPGLPVHHHLPEFTQTHVHRVGDAIQPSHPLSSPSPPAPNPSQHQSLFQWVNSLHEVVKVLEFQLQHQSFQWTARTDLP